MAPEASVKVASNRPRLRRRKPESFADFTSAIDGGQFARRELRDRLEIAAVFVAEGEVVEEVFDGFEAARLHRRGAGGSDTFHVGQGCIEREGQI